MGQYELTFDVDDLSDDTIDKIYDRFDAVVGSHADVTFLTLTAEGPTAVVAAKRAVEELESELAVVIGRVVEDLVSRVDIATRSESTPQAVGQWIRGDRHRGFPFPQRYSLVAGGVWLWGEVNEWLRRVQKKHDESMLFPRREDHDEINAWLKDRRTQHQVSQVTATLQYGSARRGRVEIQQGAFSHSDAKSAVVRYRNVSGTRR